MGDIAARREKSLTMLATALSKDLALNTETWPNRWQAFGAKQPHNPVTRQSLGGLEGMMAIAAQRFAQYQSAGWATVEEWASVGGEIDDSALGLVLVTSVNRCCADPYCRHNSCGRPPVPFLRHRIVVNRSQLIKDVDVPCPAEQTYDWNTDNVVNLFNGFAADWQYSENSCITDGFTVQSPPPSDCRNISEFASCAVRVHIMWALSRCEQSFGPTVARTGLEYELAAELGTMFLCTALGVQCLGAGWPTFEQWPTALQSPAGWATLLSAGTVGLAAASLLIQMINQNMRTV